MNIRYPIYEGVYRILTLFLRFVKKFPGNLWNFRAEGIYQANEP